MPPKVSFALVTKIYMACLLCSCLLQICEHYIVRGLCTNFPDWSIAPRGSDANLKIGYDYGRLVTGEVEEAVGTESDHVVPDPDPQEEKSMVATSAEVCFLS